MKHLYVHIPFCRSRCAYCDFASEPVGPHARAGRVEAYLEALRAELAERAGAPGGAGTALAAATATPIGRAGASGGGCAAPGQATGRFETIYVGGGTPTVLPADALVGLVRELASRLDRAPANAPAGAGPEFTIEANPGTIDAPLLERLAEAGITRLSLGVQSFSLALRAALGRHVTQEEIVDALGAIAGTGWGEWNLDLVFGIPGKTWDDAAADLAAAVAARPTHISLYDLTYTPPFEAHLTRLFGDGGRGAATARGASPDTDHAGAIASGGAAAPEAARAFAEQHYSQATAALEAAGYRRYEVSNFALPGHECRHNLAYWHGGDYLGIGASAVSTVGGERRTNPRSVRDYLSGAAPEIEVVSPGTRLWEKVMLGLRTSDGVEETEVLSVLDLEARDRLLSQGCLERRYGKLRLNPGFLDVSNAVIGALLASPGESQAHIRRRA